MKCSVFNHKKGAKGHAGGARGIFTTDAIHVSLDSMPVKSNFPADSCVFRTDPVIQLMVHLFRTFLFCSVATPAIAQEVQISQQGQSFYVTSYRFNDAFEVADQDSPFYFGTSSAFYKEKKVKTVRVFPDRQQQASWVAEFDREGNVVKRGQRISSYFRTEEQFDTDTSAIAVFRYYDYDQQHCLRTDSVITAYKTYRQGDSTICFARETRKIWKSGSLINQQNAYYNEHYLGVPKKTFYTFSFADKDGKSLIDGYPPESYLEDPLKTTYDDTTFYLSLTEQSDGDCYLVTASGRTAFPFESITNPAFLNDYGSRDETHWLTDDENFNEPVEFNERMLCGYARYQHNEYESNTYYDYTLNERGLHATYFSSYYPPEEATAADQENQSNLQIRTRRTTTPVTVLQYRFEYEYFD